MSAFVPNKHNSRFSVFEDDLRDLGIDSRDYAFTVVKMLKSWAADKGFYTVPINVFTGDWALELYRTVNGSQQVKILDNEVDAVLECEVLVGRKYIQDNLTGFTRMRDVVSEIANMLAPEWIELYWSGGVRPTQDALDRLSEEYGVPVAYSYTELLDKLI